MALGLFNLSHILNPGPVIYALSKGKNPNPKTFQIAIVHGPNVHFMDRIPAIWILIFLKFHNRFLINKKKDSFVSILYTLFML